ncbi:MAG: entericidin A/B family lipoprotein [Legionellaceae bacterium]|nr:entericidin A/B family lipoprotein [Legionellaceae bacterium]
MKKIITAISCAFVVLSLLAGCSTIHGFGKDVSRSGQAIQRAS